MNLGYYAQVDGERQLYGRAFFQTKIGCLDENSVGAEIASPAQLARPSGNGHVNSRSCAMTCVETAFHIPRDRAGKVAGIMQVELGVAKPCSASVHYVATHVSRIFVADAARNERSYQGWPRDY